MNFICFNHQNKADPLISALKPKYEQVEVDIHGYEQKIARGAATGREVNFVLTDSDVQKRQQNLRKLYHLGVRLFFVYPHAAIPPLINGIWPPWNETTAHFVVNEYHAEVMRALGYNKLTINIGWSLCPLREFQPRKKERLNVLFAPIHPRNAPQDKEANSATMQKLGALADNGLINLTVRYIKRLYESGLEAHKGVVYQSGTTTPAFDEIDRADVVVAHQTFAYLAIARGVPTVMFANDMPVHYAATRTEWVDLKDWRKVVGLIRYPLDILKESNTLGLLHRTAESDSEIKDWRTRMIGDAFDPQRFRDTIGMFC